MLTPEPYHSVSAQVSKSNSPRRSALQPEVPSAESNLIERSHWVLRGQMKKVFHWGWCWLTPQEVAKHFILSPDSSLRKTHSECLSSKQHTIQPMEITKLSTDQDHWHLGRQIQTVSHWGVADKPVGGGWGAPLPLPGIVGAGLTGKIQVSTMMYPHNPEPTSLIPRKKPSQKILCKSQFYAAS